MIKAKLIEDIEQATMKGMALGNDRFKQEIEAITGRRMVPNKVGRPIGWRKKKAGSLEK